MNNLSTKSLIKDISKKLPVSWELDFKPVYIIRLTGMELDALHYVLDKFTEEVQQ